MKRIAARVRATGAAARQAWRSAPGPRDWIALALVAALIVGGAVTTVWLTRYALAVDRLTRGVGDLVFYDGTGRPWFRMNEQRKDVPLARISPHLQHAVVAVEDRRFRYHPGVDPIGLVRAMVRNVREPGTVEGGSTITQQLARTLFLSNAKTYARKLKEAMLALLLEVRLSKDDILELYLNRVYLSAGVYGVEAMSNNLFGKHASELTAAEAALIAGLVQAPSALSPWSNYEGALRRRDTVLGRMYEAGYLTEAEVRAARRQRPRIRPHPGAQDARAGYAKEYLRQQFRARFGGDQPPDWQVHTTILPAVQDAAEKAVADGLRRLGRRDLQAALVVLAPHTGNVLAIVGGRDFRESSFNRAWRSRRQPGSAFKPFVYAAALASGFTPASVVEDVPVEVDQGYGATWTPSNYGDEYLGPVTLRRALARSANAATVRLSRAVGEHMVVSVAHRNGIDSPIPVVPAIALGAVEVTPLELVAAYAPFSNGGYRVFPRLVRRIERINGSVIWSSEIQAEEVMDPRDAFQMTSMLRGVIDAGTGSALRAYGVTGPVAGKTGTSNDAKNVWFVGYTPTIVAGFWFGFDTPQSLGGDANGGRLAAPAWAQFYLEGWRERGRDWPVPEGLVARTIDMETGYLAGEFCPLKQREWFKIGTEPTEYCLEHEYPAWDSWFSDTVDTINGAVDSIRRRYEDVMGRRRSTDTLGRRPDTTRRPTDSIGQLKQLLNKLRKPPE